MIDLFPKAFRLLTDREVRLPPFSVTSTMPSLMNGGKDFSPWSKRDDLLYTVLRVPVEGVLGRDGVCLADCAMAESKFEKGENIKDRVLSLMADLERVRRSGTPDMEFAVVGLLARTQADAGRADDARQTLVTLRERFEAAGEARFLPNLDAMLCRVDLRRGDDDEVSQWYREKAPKNPQEFHGMKRYQYLTQAMAELKLGEESRALLTLAPLKAYFAACRRYIDSIHLHVLLAIARAAAGGGGLAARAGGGPGYGGGVPIPAAGEPVRQRGAAPGGAVRLAGGRWLPQAADRRSAGAGGPLSRLPESAAGDRGAPFCR